MKTFIVRCSYFEIYNDYVYDLLAALEHLDTPMHVCEDSKRKDFYVKGLKEYMVNNLEECLEILKIGETNRHYAATSMNHQSSRSHSIFRLSVQSITRDEEESLKEEFSEENSSEVSDRVITEAILNFVDLAGSEKVSNH